MKVIHKFYFEIGSEIPVPGGTGILVRRFPDEELDLNCYEVKKPDGSTEIMLCSDIERAASKFFGQETDVQFMA